MGKKFIQQNYGHAAETRNGQEIGLQNELKLLTCILQQGWIRDFESTLLTGLSQYTIGTVSRRLADKGEIYRERHAGNAGFFFRLLAPGAARVAGRSGKDIKIPASWAHDMLAIQALGYLAEMFKCDVMTEACLRHEVQHGKLPDGQLNSTSQKQYYFFEQERSKKDGLWLKKQSANICKKAAEGVLSFISYPFPAKFCGNIDHETKQTKSIRNHLLDKEHAANIKFVRCHFDSLVSYQNMHPTQFEVIDLPALESSKDTEIELPATDCDEAIIEPVIDLREIIWTEEVLERDSLSKKIAVVATVDDDVWFEGSFEFERGMGYIFKEDGQFSAEGFESEITFTEFIKLHKSAVEKNIRGEFAMQSLNSDRTND